MLVMIVTRHIWLVNDDAVDFLSSSAREVCTDAAARNVNSNPFYQF